MLGSRYLKKLGRDRLMMSVFNRLDNVNDVYEAMDRVGFFEESFEKDPDWYLENLITPINMIKKNVLNNPDEHEYVVLLTTGGFSPLHLGHVEMMQVARGVLELSGYCVVGGYFSPSHDEYVGSKRGGEAACGSSVRVEMIRRCLVDSDWLSVDPWESMYCEGSVNYTEVIERLGEYLNRYLSDLVGNSKITVCYVFGTDNVGFVDVFRANEGSMCVYVGDRAETYDWVIEENLGRTFFKESGKQDYSSSDFRNGRNEVLSGEMRDVWDDLHINNRQEGVYEIRDDFALAVNNRLYDRMYMKDELIRLIDDFVDYEISLLSVSDQVNRFEEWRDLKDNVVSLDVYVSTGNDLGMSRSFEISSGQYKAIGFTDRIGYDNERVRKSFDEGYWVVDDDTASGYTLDRVRGMVEGDFLGFIGLNDLVRVTGTRCVDVVDLRDFVFGGSNGGLAVRLNDVDVRVMYALPYVNPVSRATVRVSDVMEFSKRIVEWNIKLYKGYGIKVSDLDLGTVRFVESMGFDTNVLVEEVLCNLYKGVLSYG